jgi:threonine dehydratase
MSFCLDNNVFVCFSTIGIEIIEDVPCADAVIVPVGGAGLIAGISCAVKTLKPECKVGQYKWRSL